jgi:SNF2 family DNA or RNA helicase
MSILHGSWILQNNNGYFFIWGESWKPNVSVESAEEIAPHPYCLERDVLVGCLQDVGVLDRSGDLDVEKQWKTHNISIPSQKETKTKPALPILSGNLLGEEINLKSIVLHSWQVSGLCLKAAELIQLLSKIPINSLSDRHDIWGEELRFWVQVDRWSLDLIARRKYLPGISRLNEREVKTSWQPLLDSDRDLERFARFSQLMPAACCAYELDGELQGKFKTKLELAQEILLKFLTTVLDRQVRSFLDINFTNYKSPTLQHLFKVFAEQKSFVSLPEKELNRLETALDRWTFPIQEYLVDSPNQKLGQTLFRTCFILQPPQPSHENEEQSNWFLKYALQALDDPNFVVESTTIWQSADDRLIFKNRAIEQPQETLLKGLGLASRLYEPIAQSLETSQPDNCELNPIEVYQFIRSTAWQLQENGLGVILPPGLASGTEENRLGIKINAEVASKKGERLNLKSLLNYKLEIAIGDRTVSKQEFERLLTQKSPIVEINGQWLALQPADVKAAQSVLNKSTDPLNLSVEDALRLSTGDTKTLAKLPVVNFEASGILQELINNLTDNKSVKEIAKPKDFVGELRPYQARGVGWLSFLEQWGLGACLADDMGLGKCVAPDTQIYINGNLITAEKIWDIYSENTYFDGEGSWSTTTNKLLVNSLDEETGKIGKAPITRLYRQQVKEKLQKITLKDGSSITITKKHKLLTNHGWTNQLQVGDRIAILAKTNWEDKLKDLKIIEKENRQLVSIESKKLIFGKSLNARENNLFLLKEKIGDRLDEIKQTEANFVSHQYFNVNSNDVDDKSKVGVWQCQTRASECGGNLRIQPSPTSTILCPLPSYSQISAIEEIDYEGWVYDFEVEKHHNFVANNIICHNTIQTIAFLLNLKEQEVFNKPVLLVCPTSVLNNWEREVKKFAPTLATFIHHGYQRYKGKEFAKTIKNKSLVITSYSLVFRDGKTLEEIDWQGVILDEAQNIKNPSAKQSQAVRKLQAGFRISLTGTPVENKLSDLWSIIDFLNPGFLGTPQFFQKRFAIPIEKYGDRDSLQTMRSLVQPFILRRLKTDKDIIQDLPEKQEMNVFCGLSSEQAEIYQYLVEKSLEEIDEATGIKRRGLILTLILRLKQLCNHPELIKDKSNVGTFHGKSLQEKQLNNFADRSGKLLRLEEMLEEIIAEDDRALIFTQFSEWGEILKPYLEKKLATEVLFLYGATSREKRQEMVDRFQNDPNGPRIFILSLKAGGTGLNLTRANHVFHIDRWWNPAVENQATDRAFRIGQKRNVQVHKFVCTGTLEEKINDTIESKQELANQTVDAGEQWLTELDTDRLRNLLLLDRKAVMD